MNSEYQCNVTSLNAYNVYQILSCKHTTTQLAKYAIPLSYKTVTTMVVQGFIHVYCMLIACIVDNQYWYRKCG